MIDSIRDKNVAFIFKNTVRPKRIYEISKQNFNYCKMEKVKFMHEILRCPNNVSGT